VKIRFSSPGAAACQHQESPQRYKAGYHFHPNLRRYLCSTTRQYSGGPDITGNLHQTKLIARNPRNLQPELTQFLKFRHQSYLMATPFRLRDDCNINHFRGGFLPVYG
jgi:hypothetical protein